MKTFVFSVIAFDPIKILTCWAPQNDRQNLNFVKGMYVVGEKMTRDSCKKHILLDPLRNSVHQTLYVVSNLESVFILALDSSSKGVKGQNHDGKSKVTAQFPHEEALCIRISAKWTVPDRDVGLKARAHQTALKFIYSEKATKFC